MGIGKSLFAFAVTLVVWSLFSGACFAADQHQPRPYQFSNSLPTPGSATSLAVKPDDTIEMDRAVRLALEANYQIASAQAQIDQAKNTKRSAVASFFPTAGPSFTALKYDHNRPTNSYAGQSENQYQLVFAANLTIFDGFKKLSTYQSARLSEVSAGYSKANTELSLILSVQQNFLTLLKARENVRSAQDSVTRLESQYKVAKAFFDVGLKPKLDVLQAETDLATSQDTLLQAQNLLSTQESRLNTLLVLPPGVTPRYVGELIYTPFTLPLDECMLRAFKDRPDLTVARLAIGIAEKNAKGAISGYYPQVSANYQWMRWGARWDLKGDPLQMDQLARGPSPEQWQVSTGVSWQFIDFGATYFAWKAANQAVKKSIADAMNLRQEAIFDVTSKHLAIGENAERIKVAKKGVESAKEGYRMAVARYQAQVGTSTDVLTAQASLTQAEATLTQAMADYRTALASLYVSIGQKNESLFSN